MLEYKKILVLIIIVTTSFITWKLVKDFYISKVNIFFAQLLGVLTGFFMLLSTISLFVPRHYIKGGKIDVEISFSSIITVIVMITILYIFFKYLPSKKKK